MIRWIDNQINDTPHLFFKYSIKKYNTVQVNKPNDITYSIIHLRLIASLSFVYTKK